MAQNRRPRPDPAHLGDDLNPLTTSAFDLRDRLAAKADPALIAGDEQHFAAIAREPRTDDCRPDRPPRRRTHGARWQRARGDGSRPGDPSADGPPAHPAPLRPGPVPRAHGRNRRCRAGLHRTIGAHRQHRSSAAARLALPRSRAVLRCDPRQPDGPGQSPPVSLDARTDQRLLGRGVHRGRPGRARRVARRPVRLHRQPGHQPLGADAGCARHHPGRPGRHHPRRIERGPRRRRWPGYRQDRRCSAPLRLPALLRSAPRSPTRQRAVRRSAPALHHLRLGRSPQPRRGGRPDLHAAQPRRRGRGGSDRDRPERGPPEVVRRHGEGDRGGRQVLRRAADHRPARHHALVRDLAQRRGLGRGVRSTATWNTAQRGPRRGLGGGAHDPARQVRRRNVRCAAAEIAVAEPGSSHRLQPGLAAARSG